MGCCTKKGRGQGIRRRAVLGVVPGFQVEDVTGIDTEGQETASPHSDSLNRSARWAVVCLETGFSSEKSPRVYMAMTES